MKSLNLIFLAFCILLIGCNSGSKDNLVVHIKYKTQPNKNIDAVIALKSLISEVQKEEHFKQIKLYIDPNDNSNILLMEEWEDESYYKNEHMKTEHLQKFINEATTFLAGPPEISFWRLNTTFE